MPLDVCIWTGFWILDVCYPAGKLRQNDNVIYKIKENVVTLQRRHRHCLLARVQALQAPLALVQCRASPGSNIFSLPSVSSTKLKLAILVSNPARAGPRRMK